MSIAPDPAWPRAGSSATRPLTAAVDGALAVSRLVAAGEAHGDPARVREALLAEARLLLGASHAGLLQFADQGRTARAVAGDARRGVAVAEQPALGRLLTERRRSLVLDSDESAELGRAVLDAGDVGSAVLVAIPTNGPTHVLLVAHPEAEVFDSGAVAAVEVLAAAGTEAFARRRDAEQDARRLEAHRALTRAAKTLGESLDLATVLRRISHEANRILDGDYTAVYRGTRDGVVVEAATGMPPEMVGYRLAPDQGLSGKALASDRSLLTNDYRSLSSLPSHPFFADVRSCLAVPMRWGDEQRGIVTVGYKRPFEVTEEHLGLLEAFAELAAVACTNASAHAGLALAARTDGLTGCLNHAALHESLLREIERAERGPEPALSLIMLDLDDFKAVNEEHGHLVGDEVLRRAGHALRQATRPYDIAARYGGDEFVLLAVDADEEDALEIAARAIDRITAAIGDLCEGDAGRATAGVAQWAPGRSGVELIADADRALLFGKHEEGRGRTVPLSRVPDWFRPGRFSRRTARDVAPPAPRPPVSPAALAPAWPEGPRPVEQRLRDRTRALAHVAALGAELTALVDDPDRMLATAAAGLAETLEAACATILRRSGEGDAFEAVAASKEACCGPLGAQCLREHRPLLVTDAAVPGRLAVPLLVSGAEWGAIEVLATKPGDFDEDDLHLATTFAAQVAAAIGAGQRHADALRRAPPGD